MKIAITHIDLPNESKGGVAHSVHYLANTLQSRGHQVTMFTYSPTFSECTYEVVTLPRPSVHRAFQSFAFARDLARTDFSGFDAIHCHGDGYLMRTALPRVRTFHGSAYDEARSATSLPRRLLQNVLVPLEKLDSRRAKISTGVSEVTRLRLPRVSEIVSNGVDLKRFYPGEKSPKPSLLFVGTFEGRKRGNFLAERFQKDILPHVPDAELWTVCDQDVPGANVVNFGRVSNERIAELYRKAWVFCLPSTYEGQGIPYLEAMASGLPVVATEIPGYLSVLEPGLDSLTVRPNGWAELGAALVILARDPMLRRRMGAYASEKARRYSWVSVTAQIVEVYEEARKLAAASRSARATIEDGQPSPRASPEGERALV